MITRVYSRTHDFILYGFMKIALRNRFSLIRFQVILQCMTYRNKQKYEERKRF